MGVILLILLSLAVSFLLTSGLASLLASSRPRYHRNRHFRHRVLVEVGTRGLDYPRTSEHYLFEQ